jgi:hypothetical protein
MDGSELTSKSFDDPIPRVLCVFCMIAGGESSHHGDMSGDVVGGLIQPRRMSEAGPAREQLDQHLKFRSRRGR